ncbi:hypothetical protein Clacol_005302 [Clathrus columnatus]|uniref:Uncharacterized protein n=1 Tax=Clathrus columnatus TaxID=1419009 RepID=A0AAV5A8W8_9AGAM|nr:hypothetical protein Clacol_005302 [Clathrus columnatus]
MDTRANRLSYASSTTSTILSSSVSSTLFDDEEWSPKQFPSNPSSPSMSDASSISTARSNDSVPKSWASRGILKKIVRGLGATAVGLVSDYALKKHLTTISSRIDLGKSETCLLSDQGIRELEGLYEDLLERDYHGEKLMLVAVKLRLSIIQILLDLENPMLFSQMRKDIFRKIRKDLDNQISRKTEETSQIHRQALELKQGLLLRLADELSSEEYPMSEKTLDGTDITEILCNELAYGSGEYTIQTALERIARTEWGFHQLLRLVNSNKQSSHNNVVLDCVTRLLSYENVFSCAMAIRIFGRVAHTNEKIYSLIIGPTGGIAWLVERLGELTHSKIYLKQRRWRGRSVRAVESYCAALLTACINGFSEKIVQLGITTVLFRLMKIFTIRDRDPSVHSQIKENQHEDVDIERDQIACCELISYLLDVPIAKRRFLSGIDVFRTFDAHSNRLFSDQKLLVSLASIMKQLQT